MSKRSKNQEKRKRHKSFSPGFEPDAENVKSVNNFNAGEGRYTSKTDGRSPSATEATTWTQTNTTTRHFGGTENLIAGSRKRKLSRIEFVKPKVNDVSETFSFFAVGSFARNEARKDTLEKSTSEIKKSQSIENSAIPNSVRKIDSRLNKEVQQQEYADRQSTGKLDYDHIETRTLTERGGITANKADLSEKQDKSNIPEKASLKITESLKHTICDTKLTNGIENKRCSLSGISVEDAVRDKKGLRPRANSTDGELNLPQRGFCDEHRVLQKYEWNFEIRPVPVGLNNIGNTCFLNSTLQCLAYLPPFCQSLMEIQEDRSNQGERSSGNTQKSNLGKRITQILQSLFLRIHGKSGEFKNLTSISPSTLVNAVPTLGAGGGRTGYRFRPGRQEDAHEFLVHLLDAMHNGELLEAGINPHKSGWRDRLPVARLDETTFIHRIFGGYLRSQVRCTICNYSSNTYDPFLDLSLEISRNSCKSLSDAFREFTRKETLDSENRWKCSGCKKRVCATKQLTVFRPPLSLCIQLKRFSFRGSGFSYGSNFGFAQFRGGTKITKPIEFPARLQLPLSDARSCWYSLSGIVIHVGGSASSGHYTAYVKQPRKNQFQWFYADDSDVNAVSESTVLRQKDAYLLFYSREEVKLEFPAPPPKTMTTEEATLLSRQKAHARSESAADGPADKKIIRNNIKVPIQTGVDVYREEDQKYNNKIINQALPLPEDESTSASTIDAPGGKNLVTLETKASQLYKTEGPCKTPVSTTKNESSSQMKTTSISNPSSQTVLINECLFAFRKKTQVQQSSINEKFINATTLSTQSVANGTQIEKREFDGKVQKGPGTSPFSAKPETVTPTSASAERNHVVEINRRDKSIVHQVEKDAMALDSEPKSSQSAVSKSAVKESKPAKGGLDNHISQARGGENFDAIMKPLAQGGKPPTALDSEQKPASEKSHTKVEVSKSAVNESKSVKGKLDNRIRRARDGDKLEVIMRPLTKGNANFWKPHEHTEIKSEAFGLLGTVAVSKWDDESDSEKGFSNEIKGGETVRANILKELEQKEKIRKRKMHRSSWDSALDLGKSKKVKLKEKLSSSEKSDENPFQRIQSSMQRMEMGRSKARFRRIKLKK